MPLIGYARISTEDQTALPQVQELRTAGCVEIVEEQASGGSRSRPVLARVLDRLRAGDTLVVVRIDRPPVSGKLSAALVLLYFSGGRDRTMIWDTHRNAR